jgi:hypothetical protein
MQLAIMQPEGYQAIPLDYKPRRGYAVNRFPPQTELLSSPLFCAEPAGDAGAFFKELCHRKQMHSPPSLRKSLSGRLNGTGDPFERFDKILPQRLDHISCTP